YPGVRLDSPPPPALFSHYDNWAPAIYNAMRPIIYVLAVLAALLALYRRSWLLVAPMIVHTANLLVHAMLGLIYARYIQLFDTLLVAQATMGWALARNAS